MSLLNEIANFMFLNNKTMIMRKANLKFLLLYGFVAFLTLSCNDNKKEAENREEEKVGNVYDSDVQGTQHENRDNQFNTSRNDNIEGTGQETGAPSDTIDGDGDRGIIRGQ